MHTSCASELLLAVTTKSHRVVCLIRRGGQARPARAWADCGFAGEEARLALDERGDEPSIDEDLARRHGLAGDDLLLAARGEVWEKTLSMVGRTIHA